MIIGDRLRALREERALQGDVEKRRACSGAISLVSRMATPFRPSKR